jgi:Flp pilus assembly protein TadG
MSRRPIPRPIHRDEQGVAVIEFAFALPVIITFIWGIFQLGLVFQAQAGMQHALGEGARLATLYPTPTDDAIKARVVASTFGTGNGTFDPPQVTTSTDLSAKTISVTYKVTPSFLFISVPQVSITRSKKVYMPVL